MLCGSRSEACQFRPSLLLSNTFVIQRSGASNSAKPTFR
jgi:hypothetical protein